MFSTTFERLWNHLFHCWKHVAIICRPNIWFFFNLNWIYLEQCLLPPYLRKNPFWFPPSLTFVSVPLFQFSQIWGTYYTILVNKYDFKLVVLQLILLSHRHLKHLKLMATKSWSCWELLWPGNNFTVLFYTMSVSEVSFSLITVEVFNMARAKFWFFYTMLFFWPATLFIDFSKFSTNGDKRVQDKNHDRLIWKISLQENKCLLQNFKIPQCSKFIEFWRLRL